MKSPGDGGRAGLGGLLALAGLLAVAGCGPFSSANPVGPGKPAPAAAGCPARYSFEDGSLADWSAPSYAGGFGGMVIDTLHPHCGQRSLHVRMTVGGASNALAIVQTYFAAEISLTAATRTVWVYFEQAPPSGVELTAVFVGQNMNWVSPGPSSLSGFAQGWNELSGSVTCPAAAGLLLQFSGPSASSWSGDAWIDDIDW